MRRTLLLIPVLSLSSFSYSQTTVVFEYDSAGNQIYRGTETTTKTANQKPEVQRVQTVTMEDINKQKEEQFWSGIRIYPVPVKDVLTIEWTDEVNDLIENVSLYEHNTIHWKFQQQNLPNLNKQVQINMRSYYMGVYILHFQLKDGRVYSKNIIKN
ncbi:T9SS type A sorting domain-containing protein [Cruoricaptor ignavus]|uniref:T9SS type A sorting domain-containing protein n=1 Tax=Cruoricaptor ignavus TaxID=1118202 RepID=UPI00370DBEAF